MHQAVCVIDNIILDAVDSCMLTLIVFIETSFLDIAWWAGVRLYLNSWTIILNNFEPFPRAKMCKDLKILIYPTPAFLNCLCTESFATEMAATYRALDSTRIFEDCQENLLKSLYQLFFGNFWSNDTVDDLSTYHSIILWFLYIQIISQRLFSLQPPVNWWRLQPFL